MSIESNFDAVAENAYISTDIQQLRHEVLMELAVNIDVLPSQIIKTDNTYQISRAQVLEAHLSINKQDIQELTNEDLVSSVERLHKLEKGTITNTRSRQRTYMRAYRQAVLLLTELNGFSAAEVGKILGGREHSTVWSALKKARETEQLEALIEQVESVGTHYMHDGPWAVALTLKGIYTCGIREISPEVESLFKLSTDYVFDFTDADTSWALWEKFGHIAKDIAQGNLNMNVSSNDTLGKPLQE